MLLLNSKSNTILSDGELTQDGGIDAAIIREERRGSFSSMHVFKITERTRSTSQKRPLPSGRFFGSFFLPAARREKSVSSLDRRRRSPSSLPLPPFQSSNPLVAKVQQDDREKSSYWERGERPRNGNAGDRSPARLPVFARIPAGSRTRVYAHARTHTHTHRRARLHATHYACTPSLRARESAMYAHT